MTIAQELRKMLGKEDPVMVSLSSVQLGEFLEGYMKYLLIKDAKLIDENSLEFKQAQQEWTDYSMGPQGETWTSYDEWLADFINSTVNHLKI